MGNRATYQPQANYFGDDSFEYLPYSAYYETTVSIQIESVNDAPTFTTTALPAAQERADYIATVVASDVEGDPLTITADYLPAWLTLTDNGNDTATLTATAIPTKPGDYVVRLIVSDGTASTMKQFSLHVDPGANRPPAFSTTAPTAATSEQLYQYEIAATDPDNNPLQFLVTGGGDWLTLTDHGDGTATLWGTPTNAHAGPWNITLTVGDGFVKVNQQFTIDVTAINHAPTITFEGTLSAVADTWFHAPYELFGRRRRHVTWQIIQDVGWLWPSPTNPTELTGLPSNSDAGDRVLTLRLSDGVQTVDYSFTVHVTAINHAPVLITPFVPSAIGGSNYQFTIAASDPDSDPLSLSATNLPAWLTFTDNGNGTATLSGTPTNANAGDYTFNLQISDGAISTQRTFSLTVARGPITPRPLSIRL
jgi:hypothetical protein